MFEKSEIVAINNIGKPVNCSAAIWQIFDQEVLYSKSFFLKRLEEELIVTNSKHRDVFVDHDPDLDEPEEEQ